MPDGAPQPGGGGFGQPGERKISTENEATQWRLVIRQAMTAGWALDGIWFVLLGLGLAFWAKWGWRSFNHNIGNVWPYLVTPFLLVWILPLGLLIWRMCAEVADPGYATPRAPVPSEYQREGPRWPGTPERWTYEDVEENEAEVEPAVPPVRELPTLKVPVAQDDWQRQLNLYLPDLPGLPEYMRQVAIDDRLLSTRKAAKYDVGRDAFEAIRDQFLDRGLAYWENPKRLRLRAVGRKVATWIWVNGHV